MYLLCAQNIFFEQYYKIGNHQSFIHVYIC